uniref:RING-Gid-type domain-containing protein n=1 Tax=Araucaria cunninghamii TaxID=56994 RepID=A0A0D6R489_ARACU
MELNNIKDAFDRVSKKQKLSYSKSQDLIDSVGQEIEAALRKLMDGSAVDQKAVIAELNAKLNDIGAVNQLGVVQKELNPAVNKYGKLVEKHFYPDIAKAYREVDFDGHVINRIIASHFYRQGLFELGDCFVQEANVPDTASLKAPFVEMYQMLEQMKAKNLQPALAWAGAHHDELLKKGSSLEFKLHRLQFMQILQNCNRNDALQYARSSFAPFAPQHMTEIQKLMACLLWKDRLEVSPYSEFLSVSHWDALALELTQECCSLLGQSYESPLHVTISAGCQALPTLLKLANVMANKRQEWQTMKQLPVEIELDREFQFHSIFACPVSRDQSTDENPPMLMRCGHVLCKQSIAKLSKGSARTFKCPYCPDETTVANCRQLYF